MTATPAHPARGFFILNMIAPKDAIEPQSTDSLPNSRRVYIQGRIHPELRVPMREIAHDINRVLVSRR